MSPIQAIGETYVTILDYEKAEIHIYKLPKERQGEVEAFIFEDLDYDDGAINWMTTDDLKLEIHGGE